MLQLTAIVAMGAVVLVLGVLQYRWTSEIGKAEHERLKSVLGTSVRNFNQEFSYDFERLGESLKSIRKNRHPRSTPEFSTSIPTGLERLHVLNCLAGCTCGGRTITGFLPRIPRP